METTKIAFIIVFGPFLFSLFLILPLYSLYRYIKENGLNFDFYIPGCLILFIELCALILFTMRFLFIYFIQSVEKSNIIKCDNNNFKWVLNSNKNYK